MQSTGPGRTSGEEDTEALNRESRQKQACFHSPASRQLGPCDGTGLRCCTDLSDQKSLQEGALRTESRGCGNRSISGCRGAFCPFFKKKFFKILN